MKLQSVLGDIAANTQQTCINTEIAESVNDGRAAISWDYSPWHCDASDDKHVVVPDDRVQLPPLLISVTFQPPTDGIYDVGWIKEENSSVEMGDEFARLYRVSDGSPVCETADMAGIIRWRAPRNRKVCRGDKLVTLEIPRLSLPFAELRSALETQISQLAQSVNAAIKGERAARGIGGQTTNEVIPIRYKLNCDHGIEALFGQVIESLDGKIVEGDIIVISEKVIATAQQRFFPRELISSCDPKATDEEGRLELLNLVSKYVHDVDDIDLIMGDFITDSKGNELITCGVGRPNQIAAEIAERLRAQYHVDCDVVISDTDTGLDVLAPLIGCVSIGATPIGATAGLSIYDCIRVANAAEECRGSSRGVPIVICRPHVRCRFRSYRGEYRGYEGRIDATRERKLGSA